VNVGYRLDAVKNRGLFVEAARSLGKSRFLLFTCVRSLFGAVICNFLFGGVNNVQKSTLMFHRRSINMPDMPYVMRQALGQNRLVIITLHPSANVPNAELEAELKKRLESHSFSVERISIIDDQQD